MKGDKNGHAQKFSDPNQHRQIHSDHLSRSTSRQALQRIGELGATAEEGHWEKERREPAPPGKRDKIYIFSGNKRRMGS